MKIEHFDKYPYGAIRIVFDDFYIDLFTSVSGLDFETIYRNSKIRYIEGVKIRFAGIDELIKMKSSIRQKDIIDKAFLQRKKIKKKKGEKKDR